MKRRSFIALLTIAALTVAAVFGSRYLLGSWAPTKSEGGLQFSETPELTNSNGVVLPKDAVREFVRICSGLRSTTRNIGEDRGSGFVRLRFPKANETDFLTIYRSKNVVFLGWWIDAKTFSMMGGRAPCFELSTELDRFIQTHDLKTTYAEQGVDDQAAAAANSEP